MEFDKSISILVVDDYAPMRRIVGSLLRQLGFEHVEEAKDGEEALTIMKKKPFGLVISDWKMAPLTGIELLKRVRADAQLKATPFIMISSESAPENVAEAKKAGASEYLVKPFNADGLKAKVLGALDVHVPA